MLKRIIVFIIMLLVINILFCILPVLGLENVLNNACQAVVAFMIAKDVTLWIFSDEKADERANS